jgi:hypothetical protein
VRAPEPDFGVSGWDWSALVGQVAARGKVVIYHVKLADYRHAIAREAARHGLKVRAIEKGAIALEL